MSDEKRVEIPEFENMILNFLAERTLRSKKIYDGYLISKKVRRFCPDVNVEDVENALNYLNYYKLVERCHECGGYEPSLPGLMYLRRN